LHNHLLQAVVRENGDAGVIELDSYSLQHNFADALAKREEHYYRKLSLGEQSHAQSGGIASAHDRVHLKQAISPQDIEPDARPSALFLDTWAADPAGPGEGPRYQRETTSEGIAADFRAQLPQGLLRKRIALRDNRITVSYRFAAALTGRFD